MIHESQNSQKDMSIQEFEACSLELSHVYQGKILNAVNTLTKHLELLNWGTADIRHDALVNAYARLIKSHMAEGTEL